ncbi:serine--tRNA ligase [Patescibacteria group bacterium]|nr:serine--tRNA ligase [Patescibacteria group bacterium]
MLDITFIRNHPNKVKEGCRKKQVKVDIGKLLELDKKKREYLNKSESFRAEQNKLSSQPVTDTQKLKKAKELKLKIKDLEKKLEPIEKELNFILYQIPNLPLDDVPFGKDEKENIVIREWGEKTKFDFKPKDYLGIAQNLDLIDVKRAAKVSGTRFGFLKREAALLEFALINLVFDTLIPEGFIPVIPPVMIKPEMMRGMGYIERGREEVYFIEKDNLYLVGTSEQIIGPMHANEVFEGKDLPKRYFGFSSCFRREAGAYGKDTKGIFRVHQFDKAEMFSFCHPEESKKEHLFFLEMEEKLIQRLSIPYRVVQMCTGDLGTPAAAKYDIEAWIPSEERFRETHSTSNCTDFQARRLNIRYRDLKTKKLEFAHTINGTAFAIGRILIAIIENYQQRDGSVKIPKVLQRYLKFKQIGPLSPKKGVQPPKKYKV